jgi:3-isopropylmalate/(R)-2-methylmalate dehydratase small subunit
MSQIQQVSGTGVPVLGGDIDTDRIIPARFLRCVTFDGLGTNAFADDRTQEKGNHPFDLPQYQGANVLVVNANFGCGSSREHAPQALAKWGIQAIVGESFAEIFFSNCLAIGVPCVTSDSKTIKQLQGILTRNPQAAISVNLETMQVTCDDFTAAISLSDGAKQKLLTGTWDDCGQLVSQVEAITATANKLPYLNWQ